MDNDKSVFNEMEIDENEFFRQATLKISSSLNINTAMGRCIEYLQNYLPITGMHFGIYEEEFKIFRLVANIWMSDLAKPKQIIPVPEKYWAWIEEKMKAAPEATVYNYIDTLETPLRELGRNNWPETGSIIIMDLELENQRLGVLVLYSQEENSYSKKHARLVSLLHDPFAITLSNILQYNETIRLKEMLTDDNRYLYQQMRKMSGDSIIGSEFGLKGVMEMVYQIAPLNSPVLLMGETGVGKEVIANAIHYSSQRRNGPFIKVNCGGIPESLVDSELFGHDKGAFTGALSSKRGRFERAHTGTIFLDEIGELPLPAQIRLLRVVQQKEIERVGGTQVIPVDVRIISATHKNLEEMIKKGSFREDLWFRLNVFPVIIPPLRQRKDDIPALVSHFIERKSRELKMGNIPALNQDALQDLKSYPWPGNVRELENVIERAMIHCRMSAPGNQELTFDRLNISLAGSAPVPPYTDDEKIDTLDRVIMEHIKKALRRTGGKVEGKGGAAELLGVHPNTLRGRMKKLNIPFGKEFKTKT